MEEKEIRVETIKLALTGIEEVGLNSEDVLRDSIDWLYERYSASNTKAFLEQAAKHMQAYVQLGFPYEKNEEVFDEILDLLQTDRSQIQFLDKNCTKIIRLNKKQVRSMIGRWSPHLHSMTINAVVVDIIDKVEHEKDGVYTYSSGRMIDCGRELPKDEYRLIVDGQTAQFFDLRRKLYYTIEKE